MCSLTPEPEVIGQLYSKTQVTTKYSFDSLISSLIKHILLVFFKWRPTSN